MAANTLADAIIGDSALARFIFKDERKRRRIPKLKAEGWPIYEIGNGKRAAFPDELRAYVRKTTRRSPPRKRSKVTKAETAKAEAAAA